MCVCLSDQILFVLPKITICILSHWALTNSEVEGLSSLDRQMCNKCQLYRTQKKKNTSYESISL